MKNREKGIKIEDLRAGRESFRFESDIGTKAKIFVSPGTDKEMVIEANALNESYTGCCLLCSDIKDLEIGSFCKVSVGPLGPYSSQVRWIMEFEKGQYKVGFRYQE